MLKLIFIFWWKVKEFNLLVSVSGVLFFEGTVRGETYLTMLHEFLLPQLQNENLGQIIFIQGGAPPHFANVVRTFLDETFTSWIGRRGTTDWPARSADLTPCDFALWGIVKEAVFFRNPDSLQTLRQYIREEIQKSIERSSSVKTFATWQRTGVWNVSVKKVNTLKI